MGYLLDSDVVIDHLEGIRSIQERIGQVEADETFISMVTYMELYQGVYRDPDPLRAEALLSTILNSVGITLFSEPVTRRCAMLREDLKRGGRRVRHRYLDLINAATALEYDFIFVTRNTVDYDDISWLRLHP